MPPVDVFNRDQETGRLGLRPGKPDVRPQRPDPEVDVQQGVTGPLAAPLSPPPPGADVREGVTGPLGNQPPGAFQKFMSLLQNPLLGEILGTQEEQKEAAARRSQLQARVSQFQPDPGAFFQPQPAPDFSQLLASLAGRR